MEHNQYLSMFIEESKEHLQALNENLLRLEGAPEDIATVQNIFRSAHTLKGMSATMGYNDLASLTHEMENVLDLVRNRKLKMDSIIFDVIFKSVDSLDDMVKNIIAGGSGKEDVTQIVNSLKSIFKGEYITPVKTEVRAKERPIELDEYQYSVLSQSIESGHFVFFIEVAIRENSVLKAARAYMVFNNLEENGEVIKTSPSVEEIEQEKFEKIFSVYFVSQIDQATLEKLIMNISEIDSVKIVPIDQESLQLLSQKSADIVQHTETVNEVAAAAEMVEKTEKAHPSSVNTTNIPVANRTIRVDLERLDTLMNLFSELLIDRVRLEQLASEIRRNELTETVEHMTRVSSDLQNIVLKLRMVPIESVFNRFPRMIRDLAKSLDKKVDLIISGAETEVDRTVIDEIGDPLVHLLRNAIDHGIESISERIKAGKPEIGTINLRAFHSGNHIFIEIEEDGKGINREKVLQTALKNGVVLPDQALRMKDEEVYQLLFASGFSTADKISDISGRGVGLDVVKTKIMALGGHVTIESKLGAGTKFSVQLPLTLSIISAMMVRVGNEKYAIPLNSIVETAIIQKQNMKIVAGAQMLDYRNNIIPIVSLSKLFDVPGCECDKTEMEIVIIRKGDKVIAVMVDEFISQQEIVLKTMGKYITNLFAISGATILGNGQVALIIDTNGLFK